MFITRLKIILQIFLGLVCPFDSKKIILLFFLFLPVYAQNSKFVFEHLMPEQVTSPLWIPCIYQDRTGYLWFGTVNGAARYDGYGFTMFRHKPGDSTVSAWVETLYEDRSGNMWFGTSRGLDKLDPSTNAFKHYLPNPQKPIGDWSNWIFAIHEDSNGTIWVGTGDGLYKLDPRAETFAYLNSDITEPGNISSGKINSIYEDKAGSLWFGTDGGLDKFDARTGKFIHYWHNKVKQAKKFDPIYCINNIFEDHTGILWLATNGGLVAYNQNAGTFTKYLHDPMNPLSLSENSITSVCEDESGVFWIGTGSAGLNAFDRSLNQFSHYTHDELDPESLTNNSIRFVFREHSGTLWIGTNGGGVNKLNRTKPLFPIYKHDDKNPRSLLSPNVISILEEKSGKILIATVKGVDRFDPVTETFVHLLKDDGVLCIIKDCREILWIGTEYGLHKYDGLHHLSGMRNSTGEEFHKNVTCMCEGNNGLLWIGAGQGELLLLDTKTNVLTSIYRSDILQTNTVFEDSHGLVWAGMWDGGLICYDPVKDTIIHFISEWGKPAVLSSNHIMSIYEDKAGIMWFGANNGLNKFDRSTGKFTIFTEYKGLSGVISILGDDHKILWMSTRNGITKFNPVTMNVKNYEIKLELWGGCRTNDGEMYFGGPEGFTHFFPDSIKDNSFVPPIVITSIHKFNEPVQFTTEIDLPYTENFISFEFAALSYVSSERNQYAYMMEGLDKDWIFSGTRHYASYPNMEPGEYIFRVKGSNNDGVWNEAGTSVTIIITPPWWKTWWFTTLFWLTIVSSIGGTIRFIEIKKLKKQIERLEQERTLERERIRISQDMHDEVGSSLTEISILSEILKKDISKPEEVKMHLRNISDRSAEVIENIGQIIWAINPRNDPLDNLVAHLRLYTADYLRKVGIKFRFEIPDTIPAYHLSAEVRRNVFLVLKEALHNIVKHSKANEVQVSVEFLEDNMKIRIKDNGKGFSIDQNSSSGNGLINMQKRIENIGGIFNLESEPMSGTSITVVVKFVP